MLDLDLDFFLDKRHEGQIVRNRRPSASNFRPWTRNEVRRFLSEHCGMDSRRRIPGRAGERHEHVYFELARLLEKGTSGMRFDLVHVDAHADLGLGNLTCRPPLEFICTVLMHLPPADRAKQIPRTQVAEWNWLLFALANRWLGSLTYVYHLEGRGDDYSLFLDAWAEAPDRLRLAKATPDEYREAAIVNKGNGLTEFEPSIPFVRVRADCFRNMGAYDYAFLTRSPEYTPAEADDLMCVFDEFIDFKAS